jgi:hypothetical protein
MAVRLGTRSAVQRIAASASTLVSMVFALISRPARSSRSWSKDSRLPCWLRET